MAAMTDATDERVSNAVNSIKMDTYLGPWKYPWHTKYLHGDETQDLTMNKGARCLQQFNREY